MLNSNQNAAQAKKKKTEPDFDSIQKQILNLDTQKKTSKFQSIKLIFKPNEKKKSSTKLLDPYSHCTRPGHLEEKCYYKHPKRASKDF